MIEIVQPALPARPASARETAADPVSGTWLLALIVASVVVLSAMMQHAGLSIDPSANDNYPYYVCGALAAGIRWTYRTPRGRGQRVARDTAEYFGLFTVIALLGAVSSYPVSAFTTGFADPALQRVDEALRFDWLAWYKAVAAHPSLQILGRIAYQSIYLSPAVLLGYCAWADRRRDAYHFLGTFWLSGIIALVAFSLMPAVGPFAFLWHGTIPYMPESALWQPDLIPKLRAHALHDVDLGSLKGLVSAPSFHTTAAVLYMAAAWRMRPLRWPMIAMNLALLLSTPVEGTHYLSDMIAGALVGVAALGGAAAIGRRRGPLQRR